MGSNNLTKEMKSKIEDLSRAVHTPTYIANFYELSINTVKAVIRSSKLRRSAIFMKKARWKHKLGPRCVRRLLNYVRDNNRQSFSSLLPCFVQKMVKNYTNVLYDDI